MFIYLYRKLIIVHFIYIKRQLDNRRIINIVKN